MSVQTFHRIKLNRAAAWTVTMLAAWVLAEAVLQDAQYLLILLVGGIAAIALLQTLTNWRKGVLFFLTWMLFEDLVRKNLGNNMAIYFAKDVLGAACCLSFYISRERKKILTVRPDFFFSSCLFFCLELAGGIQS